MNSYPVLTAVVPDIIPSIATLRHQSKELCVCYYLKNQKVLEKSTFTSQRKNLLVLQPRVLFKGIITTSANQLLLIHNHPSNSCYPSRADLKTTELLAEMGNFFEYQLLDHIIVTTEEYFSFEEAGLIESYNQKTAEITKNHFV